MGDHYFVIGQNKRSGLLDLVAEHEKVIKRILVFEFITGGGFAQQELPPSLANEGMLMLEALVQELAELPSVQLTLLQDWRCGQLQLPENARVVVVTQNQSIHALLPELIAETDAVWPIAPETDGVLRDISQWVEEQSKVLLNSSAEAVALCSDKLWTIQHLQQHNVPVVNTVQLNEFEQGFQPPWVVKSKDGVGCLDSYFLASQQELRQLSNRLNSASDYLIQPYIEGDSLSLCCLFRAGEAWLLCCNRQQVVVQQGRFELTACDVNIVSTRQADYQQLIKKVANAIPGLWGYVGIDIMQTEGGEWSVLEINPRLTTSYVGTRPALGLNIAKLVVDMVENRPTIKHTKNQQITVSMIVE
ncbi:MAG TPA: ATP-grasp domain-containing protein [Methylococcaceae bacterium]|jgi:predicted ATP-grasp superfamily ATP-dependent carboligase|nr:ATP-grasp domain-containing protein [Methylococcaceae bacterium]